MTRRTNPRPHWDGSLGPVIALLFIAIILVPVFGSQPNGGEKKESTPFPQPPIVVDTTTELQDFRTHEFLLASLKEVSTGSEEVSRLYDLLSQRSQNIVYPDPRALQFPLVFGLKMPEGRFSFGVVKKRWTKESGLPYTGYLPDSKILYIFEEPSLTPEWRAIVLTNELITVETHLRVGRLPSIREDENAYLDLILQGLQTQANTVDHISKGNVGQAANQLVRTKFFNRASPITTPLSQADYGVVDRGFNNQVATDSWAREPVYNYMVNREILSKFDDRQAGLRAWLKIYTKGTGRVIQI